MIRDKARWEPNELVREIIAADLSEGSYNIANYNSGLEVAKELIQNGETSVGLLLARDFLEHLIQFFELEIDISLSEMINMTKEDIFTKIAEVLDLEYKPNNKEAKSQTLEKRDDLINYLSVLEFSDENIKDWLASALEQKGYNSISELGFGESFDIEEGRTITVFNLSNAVWSDRKNNEISQKDIEKKDVVAVGRYIKLLLSLGLTAEFEPEGNYYTADNLQYDIELLSLKKIQVSSWKNSNDFIVCNKGKSIISFNNYLKIAKKILYLGKRVTEKELFDKLMEIRNS